MQENATQYGGKRPGQTASEVVDTGSKGKEDLIMPPILGNILVIAALAAVVALAIRSIRKSRKSGGCDGSCGNCRGCH